MKNKYFIAKTLCNMIDFAKKIKIYSTLFIWFLLLSFLYYIFNLFRLYNNVKSIKIYYMLLFSISNTSKAASFSFLCASRNSCELAFLNASSKLLMRISRTSFKTWTALGTSGLFLRNAFARSSTRECGRVFRETVFLVAEIISFPIFLIFCITARLSRDK